MISVGSGAPCSSVGAVVDETFASRIVISVVFVGTTSFCVILSGVADGTGAVVMVVIGSNFASLSAVFEFAVKTPEFSTQPSEIVSVSNAFIFVAEQLVTAEAGLSMTDLKRKSFVPLLVMGGVRFEKVGVEFALFIVTFNGIALVRGALIFAADTLIAIGPCENFTCVLTGVTLVRLSLAAR